MKCSKNTFSNCESYYHRGGFYFDCDIQSDVKRFLYCYFDKNTAGTGYEAGMYLGNYNNKEGPFLL